MDLHAHDPAARENGRISGMIFVPSGTFRMGSERHYAEEAPVHRVTVDAFSIDSTPVNNLISDYTLIL